MRTRGGPAVGRWQRNALSGGRVALRSGPAAELWLPVTALQVVVSEHLITSCSGQGGVLETRFIHLASWNGFKKWIKCMKHHSQTLGLRQYRIPEGGNTQDELQLPSWLSGEIPAMVQKLRPGQNAQVPWAGHLEKLSCSPTHMDRGRERNTSYLLRVFPESSIENWSANAGEEVTRSRGK